jgi:N-acetylglucosaminyl-diphospho-decaprenol L-rhamnosyltransferase
VSDLGSLVSAVVVDYHAGSVLGGCLDSLVANGVTDLVVVENGEVGSTLPALGGRVVTIVTPQMNLGYGRGVNRGAAATKATPFLLVSNPDVVVHDGAVAEMLRVLESTPQAAVAGPRILRPDGTVYPSHRVFPSVLLAGAHALLAPLWPSNPATRRYRSRHADGSVDWVSGACFLIRRDVFEQVGGFDERYFMFAEDMALCWDVGQAGYDVVAVDSAIVTHVEGVSRQRATRSMVWAHHRSALRFELHSAKGWRVLLVPIAAVVLGLRLVVSLVMGRS